MFRNNVAVEWFTLTWPEQPAPHLQIRSGLPKWQPALEFMTLLIALCVWAQPRVPMSVLGDNAASLADALHLAGTKEMQAIARELAWRKARREWQYAMGHLPSEVNGPADALSRLEAPEPAEFPHWLEGVPMARLPPLETLWQVPAM